MKSTPIENDDLIYEVLMNIDQEQLVSDMMHAAEENSAITLIEFLNRFNFNE